MENNNRSQINIEVVYGEPDKQQILSLDSDSPVTVKEAIERSGILQLFPQIDLEKNAVGIWNRTVKLESEVSDGDRIEIYRPLIADPKEVRKRRAEQAVQEGRADKVTGGRKASR